MSLIGIISSDVALNAQIQQEFANKCGKRYLLRFTETKDGIMELLNFDLPEIVIINFSDPKVDIEAIIEKIRSDSWLHNFGIVGIYNKKDKDEQELYKFTKGLNMLILIERSKLGSHLIKNIHIIDKNRQIIFQWELADKLVEKVSGSFIIDNDPIAVPVYASLAATSMAQRGYISDEAKMNLIIALTELILNGIEHGNCNITYDEKTEFLNHGGSITELVQKKCQDPEVSAKRVTFEWELAPKASKFVIRDEGKGFNVLALKEKLRTRDPLSLHGRGIMMASMFSSRLSYNSKGNVATLIVKHDQHVSKEAPLGFAAEEIVFTQPGDVIFREGESSDFLYYISSGRFKVFHQGREVGILIPSDIFMGEMSFLLNNRRSATVRAESPGKLIKISRRAFISVVKRYPHYGIFLSKLLARKLSRMNRASAIYQSKANSLLHK
ncbi:MAG: cyclic nucleotide-binding domain-containing protein [Spirochaetia bacterium]